MVDAHSSERNVPLAKCASLATIESLRARLLSERAASKEAEQQAHSIALKVQVLQSRLDAEIERRKKAEVAMAEVLEVLKIKGIPSSFESSESEGTVKTRSSKENESDQCSSEDRSYVPNRNHQDNPKETLHFKGSEFDHCSSTRISLANDEDCQEYATETLCTKGLGFPQQGVCFTDKDCLDKPEVTIKESTKNSISEVKENLKKDNLLSENEQAVPGTLLGKDAHVLPDQMAFMHDAEQFSEVFCISFNEPDSVSEIGEPFEGFTSSNDAKGSAELLIESNKLCICTAKSCLSSMPSGIEDTQQHAIELNTGSGSMNGKHLCGQNINNDSNEASLSNDSNEASQLNMNNELSSFPYSDNEAMTALSHTFNGEKLKGPALNETAVPMAQASSGQSPGSMHAKQILKSGDMKTKRGSKLNGVAQCNRYNAHRLGHNDIHLIHFLRNEYQCERPVTYGVQCQQKNYATSAEALLARGSNLAYLGKQFLASNFAECGRYPLQSHSNNSILNLVDDKNGKLGSILVALNLAKQHINHERYAPSHMKEVNEPSQSPYTGNLYGLPLPYLRSEPQNKAPIVHLPMSPRSDYDSADLEVPEGTRSNSFSSPYHIHGYDSYVQPKGEVHLGNGITLYTD
ncbi:hypothetical protein KP509_39G060500 [Ceratopteris richardii]|uniref:Uncharacterized protein n=1 Tax=Ceratopteris richardii TaxID=49495 RepID=A0A8T2Q1T9_CERRI|nr:hypothetical protein KP509_39G060500 [Ceratopteris richardii]KAH7277639.1 hypothetical protein KP509_39G060500 [Ceratopteris richardii]KAH7277640.1 hypothetical protein KP509_39G060500 [Ceratopteris richardii]